MEDPGELQHSALCKPTAATCQQLQFQSRRPMVPRLFGLMSSVLHPALHFEADLLRI